MDWNLIITSTLGLITILIVVYWSYKQYKQLQNQLSSSFFAEYTKRYQEIILHLPVSEYSDESVPVIPGQSVPPFSRWI